MPGHIQRLGKLSSGWENVRKPPAAGKSGTEGCAGGTPTATPQSWGFQEKNPNNSQLPLRTMQGLTLSEPNAKGFNEIN